MQPSALLQQDDISFLKAIVERYPETRLLAGAAESSPEGNQTLKEGALAYRVFAHTPLAPTAIEADRTFLGLLMLKAALTGDRSKYPHLSEPAFAALHRLTRNIIATDEHLELCLYALACNDLGKTRFLVEEHRRLTRHNAEDHDQLLYTVVKLHPALFEGLGRLTPTQQTWYIAGLGANLNLGQYVQAENLPYNLLGMQALDATSRNLRLITELYDFAGVTGHINPHISLVMDDHHFTAFSSAIKELMTEPYDQAYTRYIASRGANVGIDTRSPEGFAQGRITALARAFTPDQGQRIAAVWERLSHLTRETLTRELNITGLDGQPGILVYYSPAVIANAIKATRDFTQGLTYGLTAIAHVYQQTRSTIRTQGNGVITVNVSDIAAQACKDPASLAQADGGV